VKIIPKAGEQANPNTRATRDSKGKSMIDKSSKNAKGSQCFNCQDYDYIVAQCHFRNLLVRKADDEIETVVYELTDSATDSDDDVRVSTIQLGVVMCSHTAVRDEYCRRFSVFHTYVTHEGKNYKLMMHGGSNANIIIKTALEKMGLLAQRPFTLVLIMINSCSYCFLIIL